MSLATRIGEEFNLVRDEGMARLNALAPYNGIIGTATKQQQENLVFSTTVGNEYKLADTTRFRKVDGKVIDTCGPELVEEWEGANLTINNAKGLITGVNNNKGAYGLIRKASGSNFTVNSGAYYIISFTVVQGAVRVVLGQDYTSYYNTYSVGSHEIVFKNNDSSMYLTFGSVTGNLGDTFTIGTISVKEVQIIDFSRNGQHPFEVYTNTALTAPNDVLAGDYVVVDAPELIDSQAGDKFIFPFGFDNPYFDVATATNHKFIDNKTTVSAISQRISDASRLQKALAFPSGTTFTISYYYKSVGTVAYPNRPLRSDQLVGTTLVSNVEDTSDDWNRHTLTFLTTLNHQTVRLYWNIPVSTTYAVAITGMLVEPGSEASPLFSTYRALQDVPSGTSLLASAFETRDYISNQVLAMQKADGTIHTETLFVDAYAVETTNEILVKNGWSKLANGLYSKGTVVGTPVGYTQL